MPTIEANGISIYYDERGEGEPLLLLMGLGADHSAWEEHAWAYERHFRCILIDNRGAGLSSGPPGPYTTRMMAEDSVAVMDALGIRQAHVSGISMGSAIAQELALAWPDKVLSLTLNCPWSRCDAYATRIFEMFRATYALLEPAAFTRLLQLWIFTPAYHREHLADLVEREEAGAADPAARMSVHAFQAQCDACINHDTRGRLDALAMPVLITVGELDTFTPPRFAREMAEQIASSELHIFLGSGHTHHWDQLDAFNQLTLDFMRRHSRQRKEERST